MAILLRCALLILAAAPPAAAAELPAALEGVPNYRLLRRDLAVGGVPSAAALAELAKLGLRTVIDLRTEQEEGLAEERAALAAAGLRYVGVPVTPASFCTPRACSCSVR